MGDGDDATGRTELPVSVLQHTFTRSVAASWAPIVDGNFCKSRATREEEF